MKIIWKHGLALLVAILVWVSPLYAGSYSFKIIDFPYASGGTVAYGINNAGQIVGEYSWSGYDVDGFIWENGVYTHIDVPGSQGTSCTGINNVGQIVGSFTNLEGRHGFVKTGDSFAVIDYPDSQATNCSGINQAGDIVGFYEDQNSDYYGFVKVNETFTTLPDNPGHDSPIAHGINDAGIISGEYGIISMSPKGFVYHNGSYTDIFFPSSWATFVYGINNKGHIVGECAAGIGSQGFVKIGETYTAIAFPEAIETAAKGINDAGQVVGYYIDKDYKFHGFLATPVNPLPVNPLATILLLLLDD